MKFTTRITRNMQTTFRNLFSRIAFAMGLAALTLAVSTPAVAQSGAIFTTDSSGTAVNGNVYNLATDVYLNGGPQNTTNAAGLPAGNYYFQVTDPSGATLLSTDSIACRELVVNDSGNGSGVVNGPTGSCPHLPPGGTNPYNFSTTVQLAPFGPTTNPGGEYKVWLTPVGDYDPNFFTDGLNTVFGFVPSESKTDNFKLRQQPCVGDSCTPPPPLPSVTGFKWYDTNANGAQDAGEPNIPAWRINGEDMSDFLTFDTFTDANGNYSFPVDASNTYTISEALPNATWLSTACIGNTSVNGSPSLANQSGNALTTCTSTTSATVATGTNNSILGPDFGNVCIGGGGGLTIGYWSNQNGAAEWVPIPYDNPYLVGPIGKNWQYMNFSSATSYAAFKSWLLNASATNMAYMLSAQLAGMYENINGGTTGPNGTRTPATAGALIYVGPSAGSAPSPCTKPATTASGFASVGAVMSAASCALSTSAGEVTIKGSSTRAYEEWLKNALDAANNNNSFVQVPPAGGGIPASCAFTSPY